MKTTQREQPTGRPLFWRAPIAFAAALALLLGAVSAGVTAQSNQTAALTGIIFDATHAVLRGAEVTIASPQLIGGPQSVVTDDQGGYRFPSLAPGVYEIVATLRGFRAVRREDIRLPAGATMTVDLPLELGGLAGTVSVKADAPMVDVRTSAAPTNFDDDLLQHVPIGRNLESVMNLTPGITARVALGGAQGSNQFHLDGTNPSAGLSTNFSAFNYNWVKEVQVVSLGAGAEYGEFTGAVVNVVVRSGSNQVSGLGEYFAVRPNAADRTANEILADWDASAQVGGPLVKDRLWAFSGFQYAKREKRPAGFTGPETTIDRSPKFITKLTAAPSSRVRLEGFYEQDAPEETGEGLGDRFRRPEALWIFQNPHTTWNARLAWTVSERTLVEVRHGGYRGVAANEPTPPNTRSGPAPHLDTETGTYSVNVEYFNRYAPRPMTLAATLTHYADRFVGRSHEFKLGVEHERSTARDEFGIPGGREYDDVGDQPDVVILHDTEIFDPTNIRTSLYAQDVWTVTDRLTISPGVRVTMNRGSVPNRGRVFSTNPVSPRVGAAWDVAADHKTVIHGHYGRYHDALLNNQFQFMQTDAVPTTIVAAVLGPNQFQELIRFDAETAFGIDPGITQSFVDQYFLGVERELFRDFSVQVNVVRRNFKNFMGFVDTGSIYEPVQRQDPGPDGKVGTGDDGGVMTVFNKTNPGREFFLFTNPDSAFRRYSAFDIVGRKRYSRNWQMLASYTWSRTVGNNNNRSGSNEGFIVADTGQRGVFANPNQAINATGPTAFDYTHEVKMTAEYRVPFWQGLSVSGIYRYRTGLAWGRVATVRGLKQGSETIRIEPRGTRRLPALNSIDLRVEKTFHAGSPARTLGVFVDIFNANNQQDPNSGNRYAVNESSGSAFGRFGPLMDPRTLRIGARFTF